MSHLANVDVSTFWADRTWPDFREQPETERMRTVVLLPLHGFVRRRDLPLDAEEVVTSAVIRAAVKAAKPVIPLIVLPPLRFVLGEKERSFLRIGAELAYTLLREISVGVKAAGFVKLVFVNSSSASVDLIDALSRDIRAELNLQTFVINTGGIGLSFSDGSDLSRLVDVSLQPGAFEPNDPGCIRLLDAANRLTPLLGEIFARAPLGERRSRPPVALAGLVAFEPGETFPGVYRGRYLASFDQKMLSSLPDKETTLVIVPTGAIEQHGHHLPVGVDAILGQAALQAALPLVPAEMRVLVAPPITFGKSNEHLGFPGTIYISAASLRKLLLAIAGELKVAGFRRISFYNTHGGNTAVLNYTKQEIEETLGLDVTLLRSGYRPPLSEQELSYGFHAGEWETALMLKAAPELVKMDRATCEFPARIDDPGELRPENAAAIFSWITSDLSTSGVMGDATAATVEKGAAWMDGLAQSLARAIMDLASPSHRLP